MWYPEEVATDVTSEPLALDDVRRQVRADADEIDDAVLTRLIGAARRFVEGYCGVRIAERTVTLRCDGFADFDKLPVAPVQALTSIAYVDVAGDDQMLDSAIYELRADQLTVSIALAYGQRWPMIQLGSRVTLVMDVGFETPPEDLVHAMMLLIGHWFTNREAVVTGTIATALPMSAEALLTNWRRYAS